MAYADQEMSSNRVIAIIIVALIHIGLGYALVTGLAYEAASKLVERVTTVDVDEPEPPEPEEEPPPPEPVEVPDFIPPPVVPPPPVPLSNTVSKTKTLDKAPEFDFSSALPTTRSCPGGITVGASEACPPPTKSCPGGQTVPRDQACPVVESKARGVSAQNQGRWAAQIQRDYPSSAERRGEQGVVTMRITVGTNGRVENCSVTGSSGSSALDDAACRGMQRYARYNPALNDAGNPISASATQSIRYQLPE